VRTEQELGAAIGARLRAETADLRVRQDMLDAVRRRRVRNAVATRLGVAAVAATVLAGASAAIAIAPGAPARHHPTAQHQTADPTIKLDGFLVTMPAGTHVRKVGAGYLVGDPRAGFFVIFAERGPIVTRVAARMHGRGRTEPVRIGGLQGLWTGGRVGELLLRVPDRSQEYLVAKAMGATRAQVLSFAARLDIAKMHVVHANCVHHNCG
jgi:hypothetical protein